VRHTFPIATTVAAGAVLLAVGCGGSSSSGGGGANSASGYRAASSSPAQSTPAPAASAGASSGTVVATAHTGLGTILVAGPKHLTVYLFAADKGSESTCSGPCAQAWPPVTTTGAPRAEGGALAADLGTTTRADGSKQLTYKGHPLYYYVSDQSSGDTTGQGVNSFGAAWWVLNPQGQQVDGS
jgi:predicted lipoprotein with Yx(FWY)xxD motif